MLPTKPLGTILQQAGLVSAAQVRLALQEQAVNQHRLGELLCEHGWIQAQTAHFFAEKWPQLFRDPTPMPLGHYFHQADLLSEDQISYLLDQQSHTQLRFGALAVANGWVKLQTINFFLTHLNLQDPPHFQQAELDPNINFNSPEYWQYLRDYLLETELTNPYSLLQLYEQLLTRYELSFTGSLEQNALINLGLATLRHNSLMVAHPLFRLVFNPEWVRRELLNLHPYDQIRLQFLKLGKAGAHPYRILNVIQTWTHNHTLLNQKVAHIVRSGPFIRTGEEAAIIEQLVHKHIIRNWRSGSAAEHLSDLEAQVLHNKNCDPIDLLTYYQVVWHEFQTPWRKGEEETELLRLGLLFRDKKQVKIANQIYRLVFNQSWLEQQISQILEPPDAKASLHLEVAATDGSLSPQPDPHDLVTPVLKPDPIAAVNDSTPRQPKSEVVPTRLLQYLGLSLLGGMAVSATIWFFPNILKLQMKRPSPQPSEVSAPTKPPRWQTPPLSQISPASSSAQSLPEQFVSSDLSPDWVDLHLNATAASKGAGLTAKKQLPIFSPGVTGAEVRSVLGSPTQESPGYWPNSYGLLYKNRQLHQTDLGFVLDQDTQQLLQTEASFAPSIGLSTLNQTLRAMLKSSPSPAITEQLTKIYQRQAQAYEFRVGDLKGIVQRNDQDRIYIGVWEADFH